MKRLEALNAAQNTSALYKVPFQSIVFFFLPKKIEEKKIIIIIIKNFNRTKS